MRKNVGNADRLIRIVAAALLGSLYFEMRVPGTGGILLLVLAGILLVTGLVGTCPLYSTLGIRTGKRTNRRVQREKAAA